MKVVAMSIASANPDRPVSIPVSARTREGFEAWIASNEFPDHARVTWGDGMLVVETGMDSGPDRGVVHVPLGAMSLPGFRDWATSDDFPQRGRISFAGQELIVDMSPEELETHVKLKAEITRTIGNRNHELDLGQFYPDGALVTNNQVALSTEPDATFVSWETFDSQRVALVPRRDHVGEYIELQGTPDWVLEIVSRSSVRKDTHVLRELYHRAGIPEYWIIAAFRDEIEFDILWREDDAYASAPSQDGWRRSRVFDAGFRLARERDRMGFWKYTLEVRAD